MAVVPELERIETLRQWGISEPLLRLADGEILHEEFAISFKGPPWYIYHEPDRSVRPPHGSQFAPLWEFSEAVTGVWPRGNKLEFIKFSSENQQSIGSWPIRSRVSGPRFSSS